MNAALDILRQMWLVTAQMAPYLLLGFAVAGVLSVFVSAKWVQRHLGGRGLMPSIKAAVLGVPLPLCSCGVIPVSAGMRRSGAGRGATTSFLMATPQTGVDSILATHALMGPVFAVARPVIALVSGIVGGALVDIFVKQDTTPGDDAPQSEACNDGCHDEPEEKESLARRAIRALRYGFITLPADIAWSLIIGIVLAGLITVLIDPGTFTPYLGGGFVAMMIMMVIGTPLYVCSTGSIPLAIGFIHMGASPGAALAFLIAGPATNAATISVTWNLLGRRTTVIYLIVGAVTAVASGLAFDALFPGAQAMLPGSHEHGMEAVSLLEHISGKILVAMLVVSLLLRRFGNRSTTNASDDMNTTTLNVEGMTCSHCAATVTDTLQSVQGVQNASVDLASGKATVSGESIDVDQLITAVKDVGYDAKPAG